MLLYAVIVYLLFLAVVASAQVTEYKFDCSQLEPASPACGSYNEMVDHKDKDLLSCLKERPTFVCFRPAEDVFIVLSYEDSQGFFHKTKGGSYEHYGAVFYVRYKSGITDDYQLAMGRWAKLSEEDDNPFFSANASSPVKATGTNTEFAFQYSFTNLNQTQTEYALNIRRSTGRFVEIYAWNNEPRTAAKTNMKATSELPASGKAEVTAPSSLRPHQPLKNKSETAAIKARPREEWRDAACVEVSVSREVTRQFRQAGRDETRGAASRVPASMLFLCRGLCRNPAIPARVRSARGVSFRHK